MSSTLIAVPPRGNVARPRHAHGTSYARSGAARPTGSSPSVVVSDLDDHQIVTGRYRRKTV
jgi:hypothetical protein